MLKFNWITNFCFNKFYYFWAFPFNFKKVRFFIFFMEKFFKISKKIFFLFDDQLFNVYFGLEIYIYNLLNGDNMYISVYLT